VIYLGQVGGPITSGGRRCPRSFPQVRRQDSRSNSALTSRGDSTRPIIFFGTFLAVFASSACASTNTPSSNPAIRRLEPREDQSVRLLNEDAALAVDLVDDPEQRHHLAERGWTSAPGRAASPINRAKGGCGEHRWHDRCGMRLSTDAPG
jgi:hypothetical protein